MKLFKIELPPPVRALSVLLICCSAAFAEETSWIGDASGDWDTPENWNNGVPEEGDDVIIANKALTVTLTHATPHLASLTIGNGSYGTILSATGWDTKIEAGTVTVKNNASITCSDYCTDTVSNRVWIAANTLDVKSGGRINADKKGYYLNSNGPGWKGLTGVDYRHTGSYGGQGLGTHWDSYEKFSKPYGSAEWPYDPGCGRGLAVVGKAPTAGGGAVFLDVTDSITIDGIVTASSSGGGSGGGIVIKCRTIVGSGSVQANAANIGATSGSGGGGRLAVHYNSEAQATVMADCLVHFEALGGFHSFGELATSGANSCGSSAHITEAYSGDGTIWFPDWQMVTDANRALNGVRLAGVFQSGAATPQKIEWPANTVVEKSNLTLENCIIEVKGNLTIKSTGGAGKCGGLVTGLNLKGNKGIAVQGDLTLENSRLELEGGTLTVDGDLAQKNSYNANEKRGGGALIVRATNTGADFGAAVEVAGAWTIDKGCFVRPYAEPSTGEIPSFKANTFVLSEGGLVDARETGYSNGAGPASGYHEGKQGEGRAASHGGRGGYVGATYENDPKRKSYGEVNHPVTPGSSGNSSYSKTKIYRWFPGGGAFHLEAAKSAQVDGLIDADANTFYYATHYASAAGGSVYIKTKKLSGNGSARARGGMSGSQTTGWGFFAPGGGGRIAFVASSYEEGSTLSNNVSVSSGWLYNDATNFGTAEAGTYVVDIGSVLTIRAEPVEFGTPSPTYSTISGITGADFSFTLAGGVPDEATGKTFYMNADSRKRGEFDRLSFVTDDAEETAPQLPYVRRVAEDTDAVFAFKNVQSRLDVQSLNNGLVRVDGSTGVAETNLWLGADDVVTFTAAPNAGVVFHRWEGDTNGLADVTAPEITVDGSVPRALIAKYWDGEHEPKTTEWIGGGATSDWNDGANWSADETPGFGDTVILKPEVTTEVLLTNATKFLSKVVVGNSSSDKATVLRLVGWETRLWADEIEIGARGTVAPESACTDEVSNRVWISCGSLAVKSGGAISANEKGYFSKWYGPGWEPGKNRHNSTAASYGGLGETSYRDNNWQDTYTICHTYGNPVWPTDPGCGARDNNASGVTGGGAILIEATGAVTVDGSITASANNNTAAGGGIAIACRTISGSGAVQANSSSSSSTAVSGGGGRIAVHYDSAAQASVTCLVRFEALGGCFAFAEKRTAAEMAADGSGAALLDMWSGPGTLWFTDGRMVTDEARARAGVLLGGVVMSGADDLGTVTWPDGTTLETCYLVLSNSAVTAQGDLAVKSTGGAGNYGGFKTGLILTGGSTMCVKGNLTLENSKVELQGGSLTVDGDLTQVNTAKDTPKRGGGALIVRAAATNGADQAYGAFVTVGGTWTVSNGTFVRPLAEPANGAIPGFAAGNFVLAEGGFVDAFMTGYGDCAQGPGYGFQDNFQGRGGSHGGRGGYNVTIKREVTNCTQWATYGSRRHPCMPGSSGACYLGASNMRWYKGGGAFHLVVERTAVLDGLVDASGSVNRYATHYTGSAGGSVFIQAIRISGSGTILADGGTGYKVLASGWGVPGCGGGGRIALRASTYDVGDLEAFKANNLSVAAGTVYDDSSDTGGAEDGTIWLGNHPGGTLLLVR